MKYRSPFSVLCLLAALCCGTPLSSAPAEGLATPEGDPPKWGVLKEKMRRDGEGLRLIRRADGHQSIDLEGRFTHMSAMVRDENGKWRRQCFENFEALDKAMRGKSPARNEEILRDEVAEK